VATSEAATGEAETEKSEGAGFWNSNRVCSPTTAIPRIEEEIVLGVSASSKSLKLRRKVARVSGRPTFACTATAASKPAPLGLHRGRFRFRVCAGLRHISQTLGHAGRQRHSMTKLQAMLTEEGGRPKRMRWQTFEAICTKLEDRDLRSAAALLVFLGRHGLAPDWMDGL